MSCNVMNEYIKLTKKHMNQYMRLIFQNKFDREIFDSYLESYLNVRYYDLNENKNNNTLKTEIISELEKRKERLILANAEREKLVNDMYVFFMHILYFDRVIPNKDLDKTIDTIYELRKELLNKENETFKDELSETLVNNTNEVDELLQKFESNEFYIRTSNYNGVNNVQRVILKYDFKLPKLYNDFAIEKAFNTGITNEDKLFVKYYLITIKVIKDIIRGNFKKQYIVSLADTLFKKQQKIGSLLNIVEEQAIQDKISFKIKYKVFLQNKEMVYSYMKRGFRFSVILNEVDSLTFEEIEILNIFKFILINKSAKCHNQIVENKDRFSNIIEI